LSLSKVAVLVVFWQTIGFPRARLHAVRQKL
jgi:hypothetical protein